MERREEMKKMKINKKNYVWISNGGDNFCSSRRINLNQFESQDLMMKKRQDVYVPYFHTRNVMYTNIFDGFSSTGLYI